MVLNQDSAASHTAKKTTDFLNKFKVKITRPAELVLESPNAVPWTLVYGTF